jgi:LuxR family maltose regulon positive regulatory protein
MRDGSRSVESSAAMVRTSARLLLGDVGGASETAALAERLEPDRAAPWRPIVTNAIGMTAYWSGQSERALEAFTETVSAAELVGNHTAAIYALGYLAVIAAERADYATADRLAERAVALAARQDLSEHWVTVMVQYAVGHSARGAGEHVQARAAIERGLALARRGGLRLDTVYGLLALAQLAAAGGDQREAGELYDRAERQLAACPDPGILRERLFRAGRAAAAGVGGVSGAAAGGGPGAAARRRVASPAGRRVADDLSERELAVLRLMPSQLSLREIGDELYVSFNTVKTHARNIYAKLRVGSREQAVARARELHLL